MSDDNRFFRYLWRFNAIVIAVAMLLAVFGLVTTIVPYWLFRSASPDPQPEGRFAPVPKSAERGFTYRLEADALLPQIGGEKLFRLRRWQGEPTVYGLGHIGPSNSSFSGPATTMRDVNVLAVGARDASSRWLFHGYGRSITSIDAIYGAKTVESEMALPAIGAVIQTALADTNRDGELDEKDRQTIYVYRAGEAAAVKLLEADVVLAGNQLDDGRYLIVYERGTAATAAVYSIPDFKLVSQAPVKNVPQ